MIITKIVLGENKRNLTWRKQDLTSGHIPVFICPGHILDTDHNIAFVIHGLGYFIELINGCHNLVVITLLIVTVKSSGRILDQRMIKHMGHFFQRPGDTGIPGFLILADSCLHFCIFIISAVRFQKLDRRIIVILSGFLRRLCQNVCLRRSLLTGLSFFILFLIFGRLSGRSLCNDKLRDTVDCSCHYNK